MLGGNGALFPADMPSRISLLPFLSYRLPACPAAYLSSFLTTNHHSSNTFSISSPNHNICIIMNAITEMQYVLPSSLYLLLTLFQSRSNAHQELCQGLQDPMYRCPACLAVAALEAEEEKNTASSDESSEEQSEHASVNMVSRGAY